MRTYIVGGAVRDFLLGRPVKDFDYVVTGATPEGRSTRISVPESVVTSSGSQATNRDISKSEATAQMLD